MKTILIALALSLTGLELWAQTPGLPIPPGQGTRPRFGTTNGPATAPRYQSGTLPAAITSSRAGTGVTGVANEDELAPMINFQGVDLNQVLEIYAQYVGRTLLRANLPDAKIVLKTTSPLTRGETIQALQAVLALNGISVINSGEKFVKVVPSDQANTAAAEIDTSGSTNLPNLGSYVTHVAQLRYVKPSEMIPLIQPFSKLANSIFSIDSNGILVIRDYAENVKRMLEMIEKIDVSVPTEYISEVIPIRYSKVEEIASALSSLGGGGGATVSIGSSSGSSPISGLSGNRIGGMGAQSGGIGGNQYGGANANSPFGNRTAGATGGANPNGTPTAGTTFAQRLNNIINRAGTTPGGGAGGGQDQITLFGQTKIIPNESSSSLLIFATRADMIAITNIIAKLDIPLPQVLVEAVIMSVGYNKDFTFGVSAAQNVKTLNNDPKIQTAGGFNNGQSFLNFLNNAVGTNGTSTVFGNSLGSGLSYFGSIGPSWDVALQAAENDSRTTIIQRPRIQTSQAKPAVFFVGQTVPYVTGTYYGGGFSGGNSSQYSQLNVGVELDVTPFINPDGLVVMDVQQEIDQIGETVKIDNNDVPKTIKRTLSSEIAVKDRETVILGGFVESDKQHSKAGVPLLMDIPLLGKLFSKTVDNKSRSELLVMMRPTVLKTPELAAALTRVEQQRLPGISSAAVGEAEYERKLIDAERKREQKKSTSTKQYDGFFSPAPEEPVLTNGLPATVAPIAHPEMSMPMIEENASTNATLNPVIDSADAQDRARRALQEKLDELNNAPAGNQQ